MNPSALTTATTPITTARSQRGRFWIIMPLLVAALLVLALITLAWNGLAQLGTAPVWVVIDGDTVWRGMDWAAMEPARQAALVGGLTLAALVVVVVVPFTLLAVAALLLTVVLLSLGLPLLLMGGLMLLLLSPLWLVVLALYWLWRRSGHRSGSARRSATMAR